MNILVLNGSPRANGNTVAMIDAFANGAKANGHQINVFHVCQRKISGCLGCEYCHTKGNGKCVQQDDMYELYPLLNEAEMLVIASPIYYFGFSGQLQCAIHRTYAVGIPRKLKKAALILSSGSNDVYEGAIYEYKQIVEYMKLEDLGICTANGYENKSEKKLAELRDWGRTINEGGNFYEVLSTDERFTGDPCYALFFDILFLRRAAQFKGRSICIKYGEGTAGRSV